MRYRDLKDERDAAVARAVEAERLSMKSEFDRVTAEFEREKERLLSLTTENAQAAYRNGFNAGLDAMADDIADRLRHRTGLVPPSLKLRKSAVAFSATSMRCTRHGGYGFTSDCAACKKENEDASENPTTT